MKLDSSGTLAEHDDAQVLVLDLSAVGIPTTPGMWALRWEGHGPAPPGVESGDIVLIEEGGVPVGLIRRLAKGGEDQIRAQLNEPADMKIARNNSLRHLFPAGWLKIAPLTLGFILICVVERGVRR